MIPVFIGFDSRESLAWHVLAHSMITRTDLPLAITPIGDEILPKSLWWRPRGTHDSTAFSNARFLVPSLMDHDGWAIFMDCDMVMGADIRDLWDQRDERYAVQVVKHRHVPSETKKFLGAEQTVYRRKNWSSLMLLNCGHPACRELSPQYVNSAPGLDLHGFAWCPDEALIGGLEGAWNVLAVDPQTVEHPSLGEGDHLKSLHFTRGGPWHGRMDCGYGLWLDALSDLLAANNPQAVVTIKAEALGAPIQTHLLFRADNEGVQ